MFLNSFKLRNTATTDKISAERKIKKVTSNRFYIGFHKNLTNSTQLLANIVIANAIRLGISNNNVIFFLSSAYSNC